MGKTKGYVSAGSVSTVNAKTKNAIRRDYMASGDRLQNQLKAHRRGKKTMVTIENPNKEETNKKYIKVPGSTYFKQLHNPNKKEVVNESEIV